jgi:sulfite exporter TauE/SafE
VNGFIPCGWVYIFVIGSVATKSPFYGAAILFIFWLGTVPVLSTFPFLYKKGMGSAPRRLTVIAGIILILVGLVNLSIHFIP